mmetsp:Transcript_31316/g.88219  ORF Transcript_31316/g.88219 Transcript_31316/m.88219 type:complete len:305 (+) Transcript_31316:171-1085(+)
MLESSLWKEDAFANDHTAVWGSWYDREAKRWGYACCKGMQRDQPCTAPKKVPDPEEEQKFELPRAPGDELSGSDHPSDDSSSESGTPPPEEMWLESDWVNPPTEQLRREQVGTPRQFVEHFCRYALGVWRRELALKGDSAAFAGFTPLERQAFEDPKLLREAERAITPLIRRLKSGETLQRGEGKFKSRSRETRTSMESKFVKEADVLQSLERMASSATSQDYMDAHETYMKLTLGNKMWNSTHVAHVSACTMKGAREYRRNRDSLNTYDMDPVSMKYMHAVKKLVHLMQAIRPNPDQSKNVVV